jgi:hypothetical protein
VRSDPDMTHLDGVPWWEAPTPRRRHACWTQTSGWLDLNQVERCACGATRWNGRSWFDRNQRPHSEGPVTVDTSKAERTLARLRRRLQRLMG